MNKKNKLMLIEISFPYLEMILKGKLEMKEYKKHISNLPKDTEIIRSYDARQYMPDRNMTAITLVIKSKEFGEVLSGCQIPHFNFQFVKKEQ